MRVQGASAPPSEASAPPRETSAPPEHPSRPRWLHYSFTGLVVATLLGWASLTPTLLPRDAGFQGLVGAVAAAVGYALGVAIAWTGRQVTDRRPPPTAMRRLWWGLGCVAGAGTLVMLWLARQWQSDLHDLMGMPDATPASTPLTVLVAVALFVGLVAVGRATRRASRWTGHQFTRFLPAALGRALGVITVAVLLTLVVQGVLLNGTLRVLDATFAAVNQETTASTELRGVPDVALDTGSSVRWDSLGRMGREFVAETSAPTAISAFSGTPAERPVRVYVGLESSDDPRVRARTAVEELIRTGGFDREVLTVVTTTGTGWVDQQAVAPLEYMYGGDTATVATQYSYLPSWLSFIVDRNRAEEAGRTLFDAVYDHWSTLPADSRPRLLVFGESLGSFGAEAAFSGVDDIRNRTDGALFVGPTHVNPVWSELTENRDPGSPQWLPVSHDGADVRFMATPGDRTRPPGPWATPRVAYLQHASDPITWWSPSLLLSEPDWLEERRGYDVLPQTRWFPLVTFFQMSADLTVANVVPEGHGHRFGLDQVDAWAAVAPPPGWTAADTARLRAAIPPPAD